MVSERGRWTLAGTDPKMSGRPGLVDLSSDPAFTLRTDGSIASWNEKAKETFGLEAEDAVGRPCWKVVRAILPGGQPLCAPNCGELERFRAREPGCAHECLVMRGDGERSSVRIASLTLPDEQGDDLVALVLMRPLDVSAGDTLRVSSLGAFSLMVGDRPIEVGAWDRRQALRLLQLLVTRRGRPVHRDQLMETFWPEADERRGRARLKVTVHALRRELRTAGVADGVVLSQDGSYLLGRAHVCIDADIFESVVESGKSLEASNRPAEALARYRESAELYRGDFLEGLPYEEWCAAERSRLRELHLGARSSEAGILASFGDLDEAAEACRKALTLEVSRESLHRQLMSYLWRQGRRDEALLQYHRLHQTLLREVGVEPAPETQRLHRQILGSASA